MTTTKNNKSKLTMKKLAYHVLKVAKENKLPHTRLISDHVLQSQKGKR